MKYWCMLNRNEDTSSLSGTVADIMALEVRGHEIPRTWASSNAWEKETLLSTPHLYVYINYENSGKFGGGTNVCVVDALAGKKI